MHKYIKKTLIKEERQFKIQNESLRTTEKIRRLYETGKKLSEQEIKNILENNNLEEQQFVIYELLMYKEIKVIHKLVKEKEINPEKVINSNNKLKNIYENLLKETLKEKKVNKESEIEDKVFEGETKSMSKKEVFLNSLKKKFYSFKKINPTYVGLVFALIFALILLRKYKGRIVPFLKSILNV